MENLKVKVNNEAESKEAQELFFELGYDFYFGGKLYCNTHLGLVTANKEGLMANIELDGFEYKELTIQQLKDMVVLKRNSLDDATHVGKSGSQYYIGDKSYFWDGIKWDQRDFAYIANLKPIKEKEMKEFLVNHDDKWTLQLLDTDTEENSYRVAVPSGANVAYKDDDGLIYFTRVEMGYRDVELIWQRSETKSLNNTYAEIEQVRQETVKVTIDELKHRVYKKDVSHLDSIDVYRVLELFNVQSHAVGHAVKKLLCSGGRGAKDEAQDIQEAIDSLIRYQEMKNEDE